MDRFYWHQVLYLLISEGAHHLVVQGNRDLMSNEMQNMRQQLEYLQAELNKELSRELHEYHNRRAVVEPRETDAEVR